MNTYANNQSCSYSVYKWNTISRKAVEFQQIRKSYQDLTAEEIDHATGCSVCSEDQVSVKIHGIAEFKICKKIAAKVKLALTEAIKSDQKIKRIVGYRVGKTRGPVDISGNRTGLSNHSFGIAIDINPDNNGLYDHCINFNPSCRLIKGGLWQPEQALSIHPDSALVKEMLNIGYQWGGRIKGQQKDFMHFSPSGY